MSIAETPESFEISKLRAQLANCEDALQEAQCDLADAQDKAISAMARATLAERVQRHLEREIGRLKNDCASSRQ